MIKINLLESITERQIGAAAVVERKIVNPLTRVYVIAGAMMGLLLVSCALHYYYESGQRDYAAVELEQEKQVEQQMQVVIKEQQELENKIKNIETRIDAIKQLRAAQAGPSAVLDSIRERLITSPNVVLDSVEQKESVLMISGSSINEEDVTKFGRSLEFSSGLFTNLNIETSRQEFPSATPVSANGQVVAVPEKPSYINFKIRCTYNPAKAANSPALPGQTTAAVNAPAPNAAPNAAPNSAAPTPAQVVKN